MAPANAEVGGSVQPSNRRPVERWSALEYCGLRARDMSSASLRVSLRGSKIGFHTG